MAIWPFSRKGKNKQAQEVPEEVQEYYQSERRERVGVAWLLALVTLVATIILAVGLYFGGRWAWHQIFGGGSETTTTTEQQGSQEQGQDQQQQGSNADNGSQEPSQPSDDQNKSSDTSQQPEAQTPVESDSSSDLTNTGPGNTLAVFLGTTILGALVYQVYMRKKLT